MSGTNSVNQKYQSAKTVFYRCLLFRKKFVDYSPAVLLRICACATAGAGRKMLDRDDYVS